MGGWKSSLTLSSYSRFFLASVPHAVEASNSSGQLPVGARRTGQSQGLTCAAAVAPVNWMQKNPIQASLIDDSEHLSDPDKQSMASDDAGFPASTIGWAFVHRKLGIIGFFEIT